MRKASKETLFVRKHYKKTPAEIIALGKAKGLTLNPKTVSVTKYNYAALLKKQSAAVPAVATKKVGKAPARVDRELVKLVIERGIDRVAAALRYAQEHAGAVA